MIGLKKSDGVLRTRLVHGLVAGLLLACLPVAALGHAKLLRSQPKAKESVSPAPKLVELWFSEELEAGLNTIEVRDQAGKRVDRGEVVLAEENKKAQAELEELAPGFYTVIWKAISADQHAMRGRFTFTVTPSGGSGTVAPNSLQTPATTPVAGHIQEQMVPASISGADDSGDRIFWGQTLVRWLVYLAMMLLFGGFAFRSLVLVPALRRALDGHDRAEAVTVGARRIVKVLWVGVFLLAATSVLALVLQASDVFDKSFGDSLSPGVLAQVLETGYGSSWILEVGSLIVIAFILILLSSGLKRNPKAEPSGLWWAGLVAGAALLVAPSWTGHAMLSVKHFRLAVFTDWLHLLAGGFWVGGLFHLALTWPALSTIPKHHRAAAVHQVIRLFTRTAMPSVVLLVLAGLYNTWAHVPGLSALWVTPYGQALTVKLLLVLFMLLLGAINNYHFGKRAARLASQENGSDTAAAGRPLERGFYRSVALETSLGLVVLLVTAVLVFLTPARNHPAMENAKIGKALIQGR